MSLEAFEKNFYPELNEINKLVENLSDEVNSLNTNDEQEKKLYFTSKYEVISNRIETLHKYFTENTAFIPVYEVRKAQEHLTKLTRFVQEKRELIMPKKKFGFKSKQNLTTLESKIQNDKSPAVIVQSTSSDTSSQMMQNSCNIKNLQSVDLIKQSAEIDGKDIGIVNLKNCTVQIAGSPSVLHIDNIESCTILCGPTIGSCFINNCKNSKLVLACHQLRIHETTNTQFYIHVGSRAIIENTNNVHFGPYSWKYPNIDEDFRKCNFKLDDFHWTSIDDFNWLSQTQKSPNWSQLTETERHKWSTNEAGQLKID